MRTSITVLSLLSSFSTLAGCGGESSSPRSASPSAAPSATSSAFVSARLGPSVEVPAASVSSVAAPPTSASAVVSASASAPPVELPAVVVKNIGMHIGGGPNDDATKAPIKRSVQPHFDAFRACFAKVVDPSKGGDVSVDLRIDKAGGKAELRKFKSALEGEGFEACVREVFAAIDFEKPKTGTTVVSYSLKFTPEKKK
jgi:hypothetical protein